MTMQSTRNIYILSRLFLLVLASMLASCSDQDDSEPVPAQVVTVDTLNIDVVLPVSVLNEWRNTIEWASYNIVKAQNKQPWRVALNLRFHNEDTEDLEALARRLAQPEAGDDTCHAIIGPYHSANASVFLSYAAQKRLPVVMPTCTSAELQRINARNTYAWFLTESDVTQCEIMNSAAGIMACSDIALIYSDDTYGQSFYDYFGFFATEHKINIPGQGIIDYAKGDNLIPFLQNLEDNCQGYKLCILLALSDPEDYAVVSNIVTDYSNTHSPKAHINLIYADIGLNRHTIESLLLSGNIGVCPTGSPISGFQQIYKSQFGSWPTNGQAQAYDAITLIALGAAMRHAHPDKCYVGGKEVAYTTQPYGPGLTDYMRAVVATDSGKATKWTLPGLATAFEELAAGNYITHMGALGQTKFDRESHTKATNTTYMVWQIDYENLGEQDQNKVAKPMCYLSTNGYDNSTNTSFLWEKKSFFLEFNREIGERSIPIFVKDHWALVIGTSTTWKNYRHQADALAMYQTLRKHGYDDDHIVLIMEDNLANAPENPFPGKIFVDRDATSYSIEDSERFNVRRDAVIDYHFSDLQPDDLLSIMMGQQSERLPHVIHPDSASNVFVFWSGHGGEEEGPLWGNEDDWNYFGQERIKNIVTQMNDRNLYRRMMLVVETCFSGRWGQVLKGFPDLLVFTAANAFESSKADIFDQKLGVFLSNSFSRRFMEKINESLGNILIYDLYKDVAVTTNGSHVMLYNEDLYGSVYLNYMSDYFPQ